MRPSHIAALILTLACALPARAQEFPTGPVRVIVPLGAGGAMDSLARILAGRLQERLGTRFRAVMAGEIGGANGLRSLLVVTRTDKRRGRGGELSPSPVKAAALELGLRVSHDLNDVARRRALDRGERTAHGPVADSLVDRELIGRLRRAGFLGLAGDTCVCQPERNQRP